MSEGPSNTAEPPEAPEPAAGPAGRWGAGGWGGHSRRHPALCLGSPELPLPPLHDDAAPSRDLPVLRPVQGPGSVLQPQGPRGAELARLPQKSGSHRCAPACGPEGGGRSEGKEGGKLSPSRAPPLLVLHTPTAASWGDAVAQPSPPLNTRITAWRQWSEGASRPALRPGNGTGAHGGGRQLGASREAFRVQGAGG